MYGMTSTPSYEVNEGTIIALGARGNKLEIIERGWGRERRYRDFGIRYPVVFPRTSIVSMYSTTGIGSCRMLKKAVQQGRSE
jgi:hypothetical protein